MTEPPLDRKRHVLLNSLSPRAFEMMVSMCRSGEPKIFTVTALLKKLETAYHKHANKRAERAKFFLIRQKSGDSLIEFANNLRNQAVECAYPDAVLDDQLCAAFSAGVESEATRKHLWALPDLSVEKFDALLEAAIKFESSQEDAKRVNVVQSSDVSAIRGRQGFRERGNPTFNATNRSTAACFCCGSLSHMKPTCSFQRSNVPKLWQGWSPCESM